MRHQIFRYAEDVSRLRPADNESPNVRMIYEPLADVVADEWLRPYVWGFRTVSFFPHYDYAHMHKMAETTYSWSRGDTVVSDGRKFELLSATCVFYLGQWCMRWYAKEKTK